MTEIKERPINDSDTRWGHGSEDAIYGSFATRDEAVHAGRADDESTHVHRGHVFTHDALGVVIASMGVLEPFFFEEFVERSEDQIPYLSDCELAFDWPKDAADSLESALVVAAQAWVRDNVDLDGCVLWTDSEPLPKPEGDAVGLGR